MRRNDHVVIIGLQDHLTSTDTSKFQLACAIWPQSGLSVSTFQENEYKAFFAFFDQELSHFTRSHLDITAECVEGIIGLIVIFKDSIQEPQAKVIQKFRERFPAIRQSDLYACIELVARICFTFKMILDNSLSAIGQTSVGLLEWPAEISLKEAAQSLFEPAGPLANMERCLSPNLDPSLTASALVEICGVKLSWTSNIMDHLRLDKRHRTLTIYEHKICLLNHTKGNYSP